MGREHEKWRITIKRLEDRVKKAREDILALEARQSSLHARAIAAEATARQCAAVMQLLNLLGHQDGSSNVDLPWRAQLLELSRQLAVDAVDAHDIYAMTRAHPPPLGWSPEATAARAEEAAAAGQLSTAELRRVLLNYARSSARLVPRIRNGAPDLDAATEELEKIRTGALELCVLVSFHEAAMPPGQPCPLVEVLLTPMCDDATRGALEPGDWAWIISQMKLDQDKEDKLFEVLQLHWERCNDIERRSGQLLEQCQQEGEASMEVQMENMQELEGLQRAYHLNQIVFLLGCGGSILSAVEFGALFAACLPWSPTMSGVFKALKQKRQDEGRLPPGQALAP